MHENVFSIVFFVSDQDIICKINYDVFFLLFEGVLEYKIREAKKGSVILLQLLQVTVVIAVRFWTEFLDVTR